MLHLLYVLTPTGMRMSERDFLVIDRKIKEKQISQEIPQHSLPDFPKLRYLLHFYLLSDQIICDPSLHSNLKSHGKRFYFHQIGSRTCDDEKHSRQSGHLQYSIFKRERGDKRQQSAAQPTGGEERREGQEEASQGWWTYWGNRRQQQSSWISPQLAFLFHLTCE